MRATTTERVKKYRTGLRASGLRPVQIWVPDTRSPGFSQECGRQSQLVRQADAADLALSEFMDSALGDLFDAPTP
ncbi:MAG TPA: antitoxin MazE family protein [Halothiobacillus sp.]|nr:antitoxin MazE family protein [Halothiobacillus sp.]